MNEYTINSRVLTSYHPLEYELDLDPHKEYVFDLAYLGILNLSGDKAQEFLQGQVTCDVNTLSATSMLQGLQCNLQGRIIALLDILKWQGMTLVLPKDILEATQKSLAKPALLSRVNIAENAHYKVFGLYSKSKENVALYDFTSTADSCQYHLGKGFFIYIMPEEQATHFSQPYRDKDQFFGSLAWHSLRLHQGHIDIYPQSRGLFLPHRLGFHQSTFISFNKGCYKGQEIIARTHYRATIKHELSVQEYVSEHDLVVGDELYDNKTSLGELVDYSLMGSNRYLVALEKKK